MIKEINNVFLKEIVSSSPSKSFELRALFACLLANNDIKITNYGNCDDVSAMRNILSQFNFELSHNNNFYSSIYYIIFLACKTTLDLPVASHVDNVIIESSALKSTPPIISAPL